MRALELRTYWLVGWVVGLVPVASVVSAAELVSVNSAGTDSGNSISESALAISADGRFVAFGSNASDLVATDTDLAADVFVRDLQEGETVLVSVNNAGTDSDSCCSDIPVVISPDDRFVAFTSTASELVATDTNAAGDVYVRDLQTGTTTLVSVNSAGTDSGNGSSHNVVSCPFRCGMTMSADGRFVVFESEASNLDPVTADTNGAGDVYVRDLQTGTTTLVSVNSAGTDSGSCCSDIPVVISPDGRFVAFTSTASELVATDTNATGDVFVRDLQAETTTLVSVNSAGTDSGNGFSARPVISADGSTVAFDSIASDLDPVTADTNGAGDVYVVKISDGAEPPECNPPEFVFADNTGAVGLYEGIVQDVTFNSITTVSFTLQPTEVIFDPFTFGRRGVSLWFTIAEIDYDPAVVTIEPNTADTLGGQFAELGVIAPDSRASYVARFCNVGDITFKLRYDTRASAITLADTILPVPISAATALNFGEALLGVPLYNLAVSHYVNAWQIVPGVGVRRAVRNLVRELNLAARDLIRLARNREQRGQLIGVFAIFGYNITIRQLLRRLILAPARLLEMYIDLIVTMIQTGFSNLGIIQIKLVAQ